MKYIIYLIAIFYLLFGLWVSLDNAQLLFDRGYLINFFQSDSYKTPIILIGGLLALAGSIMAFKQNMASVWLLLLSLIAFVIAASYDVIIKHGIYFYLHLIPVFYLAVIFRLATVVALYYAIKKLLTYKAMNSSDAGASISSRVEQACFIRIMSMRFKRRTKKFAEATKRRVY